ncbi:hypothetical protein [Streptomyces sp. NPDC017448]|uniref:hypothetical protein n=1 Tax=Streptomyces sp. NPDC017448 TaxID=3364996 RepID=UPI00379CF877
MTTTSDAPTPVRPARRRRHARLIAAPTTPIGVCAEAAGEVYGPIAAVPPAQEGVAVEMLTCTRAALTAPLLLDMVHSEEDARRPDEVVREEAASRRTYAARCAPADAHDAVHLPARAGARCRCPPPGRAP